MDTFKILLDNVEVARISGEGLEFGKRAKGRSTSEMEEDPKLLKKVKNGQSLFVLMASSQKNVSVEKVNEENPCLCERHNCPVVCPESQKNVGT